MTIGRGLIKSDDYLNFGRIVDKLSEFCYSIFYFPKSDLITVMLNKKHKDKLSNFNVVKMKERGGLIFATIRWR